MSEAEHAFHIKPTAAEAHWFENAHFCATALREMVASCVNMHPVGASLYTDGERKTMAAAAKHIDRLEQELNLANERFIHLFAESVDHMKLTAARKEFAKAIMRSAIEYAKARLAGAVRGPAA